MSVKLEKVFPVALLATITSMSGCGEDTESRSCASTGNTNDATIESEDNEKARSSEMDEKESVGEKVDLHLLAEDSKLIVYNWVMSDPPPYEQTQDEKMDDEAAGCENTEKWWTKIRVTGSCLCKLFVVIYLMACLLVSALYIAIYGPNELFYLPEAQQHQSEVCASYFLTQPSLVFVVGTSVVRWHMQFGMSSCHVINHLCVSASCLPLSCLFFS